MQPKLKRYRCHKIVQAAKLAGVEMHDDSDGATRATLKFEDGGELSPTMAWMQRHSPQAGGFYVTYEDGYASYSPAAAFESGYTLIED